MLREAREREGVNQWLDHHQPIWLLCLPGAPKQLHAHPTRQGHLQGDGHTALPNGPQMGSFTGEPRDNKDTCPSEVLD